MAAEAAFLESLDAAAAVGMAPAFHATQRPDDIAIVCGEQALDWNAFNASVNRLARGFRQMGLAPTDSIAIIARNRIEFPVCYFAALRTGLRITAVNWHLTAPEVAYILDDCAARVAIVDAALDVLGQHLRGSLPDNARLSIGPMAGYQDLNDLMASQSGENIDNPVCGSQMLYTSGTTGRPKGVIRPPRPARPKARRHYLPDHARVLCTGPLYHAAPLSQNCVQPLQQGKSVVIMPRFDAEETLRLIDQHRITHTHMVATMFHRLLALPAETREQYDLTSLETIWHGAAPTPVHIKRAMMAWLGPKLDEYYAATETGGTEITAAQWLSKPGSVGLPEEGQEILVLDDDGARQAPGEIGTVYFNGAVSGGFSYHGDQEKTDAARRGDLYTLGDQGYLDEDGFLFLTGRTAEIIISGGVNIYPAEVDAVLLMHPAIQDAAVVGVPDGEYGEAVKAVVELAPLAEVSAGLAEEIINFCREQLAHFKCPRSVDFVDRLPRSDAGKVFRHRVRQKYWPA